MPADLRTAGRILRQQATTAGIGLLLPGDPGWPAGTGCDDLPCLWVWGTADVAGLLRRAVTVTGSRSASAYGLHLAADLASGLAGRGWTVASAAGFGIDARAAQAALATDRPVLLVAADGLRPAYPAALAGLQDQVAERGAVISPFPVGYAPSPARTVVRQRLLGTITAATVVVEASARSHALTTARAAAQTDRVVCAVPGPVTSATSTGCHQLLAAGARLVTCAADIEVALGSPTAGIVDGSGLYRVTVTASWDDGYWRTRTVPPFTVTAASHHAAADTAFGIVFSAHPDATGATLTAGIVDPAGVYETVCVSSTT